MRKIVSASIGCFIGLLTHGAVADTTFNVRASLQNGYNLAGTVSIDTTTGLVTGENATLYDHGSALATFGGPTSQGVFAPSGLAPSYVFSSTTVHDYLFVAGIPSTSLVGYAGGELCSFTSAVHCARSDLFLLGSDIADVLQGILAPADDMVTRFDLEGIFANGDNVTGTVTIDTTLGYVLDLSASLYSQGTLLSTFTSVTEQNVFAPSGLAPSYLFNSIGTNDVLMNIAIPGTSLTGYRGSNICAVNTALNCAFSNVFFNQTRESDALTGRLSAPSPVPEPSLAILFMTGFAAMVVVRKRRDPRVLFQ